jgi:formylglycine-generating enzyme required for sulfatase activity
MRHAYDITAELLAVLQREGSTLGVDKQLQVQSLLQKLPDDTTVADLKWALIPLLATSPTEQDKLYNWFDEAAKQALEKQAELEKLGENTEGGKNENLTQVSNLRQVVVAILLLVALVGLGYFVKEKYFSKPSEVIENQSDTNQTQNPNDILNVPNTTPQPPITEGGASPFVENKPYPFPNHLDDYDLDMSPTQLWLADNWAWLRWVLAVVWTLIVVGLWAYRAWRNRKLIAEHDPHDKPPYFWNIHIEGADALLDTSDAVQRLANLMRRREDTDTFRLDMPRTVQASIERGGLPVFQYRQQSRPSEYLLLIDRQSVRNHRARLFDTIYQAFLAQEVLVSRYFYDSDMRVCFDEAHPYGLSIADVQQRHYQARLILIGTGAQLLSPLSGKMAAWTPIFQQWKDRVLLSPKPLQSWGYDERQLQSLFTTLPATMDGLQFWVEELEMGEDARFETWRSKIHDAPHAPIHPDAADPMPLLQLYFELPMLRWIAACAIYPTLHWDLTLWLGNQIAPHPPKGGLSEERQSRLLTNDAKAPLWGGGGLDMSELCRLPWFVAGEMPNETRLALLNWLEKTDPTLLQHLRLALATELSKTPPPTDSVAFQPFQMTVAVNEWLGTTDANRKKQLEQEIAQLLEQGAEPDFTVLKYLNTPPSPLHFEVPKAWRKFVYKGGYRGLGFLREFKDLWWISVLWVLGMIGCFYTYNFVGGCSKDKIVRLDTEGGKTHYFCLDEPLSSLVYREQLAHQYIENRQLDDANTETRTVDEQLMIGLKGNDSMNFKKLRIECHRNFAIDYYRLAKVYNIENKKDSVCLMLADASRFDSLDTDISKANQKLCSTTGYINIIVIPKMVAVKGGTFTMGSPLSETDREDNETPHRVTLSDFSIGQFEVTVQQYLQFADDTKGNYPQWLEAGHEYNVETGKNDYYKQLGYSRTAHNLPVVGVSWNDAVAYCQWLSQKTGKTYRLPTEAEWEYACRAGTTTPFNTGENLTTDQANYNGNYPYKNFPKGKYRGKTTPVGSFAPNAWGLYDMHGNVWEWCSDWYAADYYKNSPAQNPKGPASGTLRVLRGGSWCNGGQFCRSANRDYNAPDDRNYSRGFRLVFVP